MQISERKLRKLIRESLINEISDSNSLSLNFQEWVPGVCEIDIEKAEIFKIIFGDGSNRKDLSADTILGKLAALLPPGLSFLATELAGFLSVIGKITSNVDLLLNLSGTPSAFCVILGQGLDVIDQIFSVIAGHVGTALKFSKIKGAKSIIKKNSSNYKGSSGDFSMGKLYSDPELKDYLSSIGAKNLSDIGVTIDPDKFFLKENNFYDDYDYDHDYNSVDIEFGSSSHIQRMLNAGYSFDEIEKVFNYFMKNHKDLLQK